MQLAIVDSGGANIGSVIYALQRLGVGNAVLTGDKERIQSADRVILPGVGASATAMSKLHQYGLTQLIPELTQPVLGICLGLQLMFERSEEDGGVDCLGIFPGTAGLFPQHPQRRVPHMGWNQLQVTSKSPLLNNISDGDYAYFVHSYALPVTEQTLASCDYGQPFTAVAGQNNFYAAQFHPERSARLGAQLLKNFLEI